MKIYSFGAEKAPVILLLPGTCCHWKGNFGKVIPILTDTFGRSTAAYWADDSKPYSWNVNFYDCPRRERL